MKKLFIFVVLIGIFAIGYVEAQTTSKYGKDSLECLKNLSTMQEYCNIDLYNMALESWKYTFNECPRASKNIYIFGVQMHQHFIDNTEDEARKQRLIDTLMLIYDKRIKYFDQEGYVLGRKGIDLLKNDNSQAKKAYDILKKSIDLRKNRSSENILITYMMLSTNLFKSNEISSDQVLDDYSMLSDILNYLIKNDRNPAKAESAKNRVDEYFANSGAASCDNLIALYEPQYEENPEDKELLEKMLDLFEETGCEDSELFLNVTISLFDIEPTANSAYDIARLFIKKENYQKAAEYLNKTIELEEDPESKANYYYQLGVINSNQFKKPKEAKELAEKALELRPNWGAPYILIGNTFAATNDECGENEFQKAAVYWLVVDKFQKAKSVDETVTERANDLIERYKQYYPKKEDAFFYGFNEGDSYRVECWINETTTVRF